MTKCKCKRELYHRVDVIRGKCRECAAKSWTAKIKARQPKR